MVSTQLKLNTASKSSNHQRFLRFFTLYSVSRFSGNRIALLGFSAKCVFLCKVSHCKINQYYTWESNPRTLASQYYAGALRHRSLMPLTQQHFQEAMSLDIHFVRRYFQNQKVTKIHWFKIFCKYQHKLRKLPLHLIGSWTPLPLGSFRWPYCFNSQLFEKAIYLNQKPEVFGFKKF